MVTMVWAELLSALDSTGGKCRVGAMKNCVAQNQRIPRGAVRRGRIDMKFKWLDTRELEARVSVRPRTYCAAAKAQKRQQRGLALDRTASKAQLGQKRQAALLEVGKRLERRGWCWGYSMACS